MMQQRPDLEPLIRTAVRSALDEALDAKLSQQTDRVLGGIYAAAGVLTAFMALIAAGVWKLYATVIRQEPRPWAKSEASCKPRSPTSPYPTRPHRLQIDPQPTDPVIGPLIAPPPRPSTTCPRSRSSPPRRRATHRRRSTDGVHSLQNLLQDHGAGPRTRRPRRARLTTSANAGLTIRSAAPNRDARSRTLAKPPLRP